jgi:hypothetical protein
MTSTDRGTVEPVRQESTHHKLVSRSEQRKLYPKLELDAIVVPTARPAWNLEPAITLARAAHCTLVILCSHDAAPDKVQEILRQRSFDQAKAIVIDLPRNYGHELLEFRGLASIEDDLPAARRYYKTNLSTKRNLGLLLARMMDWKRIFFLDDDIRDIGYPDLQSTVSMLTQYRTAGMRVTEFPDNSAACHAHRLTGKYQDVFLTGAALAVDMQHDVGFFADIYNEDWLFIFDDVASGNIGSSARRITQLRYDPFADPRRAAWQEFGDILAEGLYALLDRDLNLEHATRGYWRDFLRARRRFLEDILGRSDVAEDGVRKRLVSSVQAALYSSKTIQPRLLERYIQLWRQDRDEWQQRIATVSRTYELPLALKELGLEQGSHGRAAEVTRVCREAASGDLPRMQEAPESVAGGTQADSGLGRISAGVRQGAFEAMPGRISRKPRHSYGRREASQTSGAAG